MTQQQFLKINKQINNRIEKLEEEAIENKVNINSKDFKEVILAIKKEFLKQQDISFDEYMEMEERGDKEKENEKRDIHNASEMNITLREMKDTLKNIEYKSAGDKKAEALKQQFSDELKQTEKNIGDSLNDVVGKKVNKIVLEATKDSQNIAKKDISKMGNEIYAEIKKLFNSINSINYLSPQDAERMVIEYFNRVPKSEKFDQKKINKLNVKQIDYDFEKTLGTLKKELIDYVNRMALKPSGGAGTIPTKGSRFYNQFFNWGMADKGSYKSAITDDRYVQKKDIGTFVDDEIPTGSINGANKTFTLANTPISGSVKVYVNGQRILLTTDYTISDNTITMVYAYPTGTAILVDYRY